LSINPSTGLITGTIPFTTVTHPATQRVFSVTVTASDGTLSSSVPFTWTVLDVDQPPVATTPGPQTTSAGQPVSLSLTATDPDGDSLTSLPGDLPLGLSINPTTGLITGTIPFTTVTHPATQRVFSVTVTASDGTRLRSALFTWTVLDVDQPPVANAGPA